MTAIKLYLNENSPETAAEKMHLLIASSMFPPVQTGTSLYTKNLAVHLSELGHEVVVLTPVSERPGERFDFEIVRVPSFRLPLKNFFKHFRITSCFPQSYGIVISLLRQKKIDAILLVNHYQDLAFPVILGARLAGLPVICSVGTQIQSTNQLRHAILHALDRLVCGHIVFPNCFRIVAWDTEIARYLSDVHSVRILEKTVFGRYGANGPRSEYEAHSHNYEICNQIVAVGAVIEQRDWVFLVKILATLMHEKTNLRCKIIGHVYKWDAALLARELGLEERIEFTGELPHAQVMRELKKSALYVGLGTGKYLGLGTASLEAMLMGLPVMCNAPRDLFDCVQLRDMENYVHADIGDLPEVTRKMLLLLENSDLRMRIGTSARHLAQRFFDWKVVASDFSRLLFAAVQDYRAQTGCPPGGAQSNFSTE